MYHLCLHQLAIGLPTTNSISSLDSAWPGSSDKRISRSDSSYSLEEWSPKECERFLDFLRHSVWVNGEGNKHVSVFVSLSCFAAHFRSNC